MDDTGSGATGTSGAQDAGERPPAADAAEAVARADGVGAEPERLRPDLIPFPPAEQAPRLPSYHELYEARRRRAYLWAGAGVVAIGLALFAVVMTGVSVIGTAVLIPGLLLLATALAWRPFYWLYLPGLALAGFGLGWIIDGAVDSAMYLSWVGLGAGLIVAYAVRRGQHRPAHWWAPASGALLVATGVLAGVDDAWHIVWRAWPLLIVVAGIVIVVRALRMGRRRHGGPPAVR